MRRRDVVFACVAWGGLLAGLVWALSTQARWVRENKPIQVQRPPLQEPDGPEPAAPGPATATGVIGTVGDDTRAAMAKGLDQAEPAKPAPRRPRPGPRRPPPAPSE